MKCMPKMPVPQPMSNMFIYLLGFEVEFEFEWIIFERYLWQGGNYDEVEC